MRVWSADELADLEDEFKVVETTERSQFAVMNLGKGNASGELGNEHPDSDQWLIVVAGEGKVIGETGETEIRSGDVILIPAPEKHQFKCIGERLRTITFYAPPGYKL